MRKPLDTMPPARIIFWMFAPMVMMLGLALMFGEPLLDMLFEELKPLIRWVAVGIVVMVAG